MNVGGPLGVANSLVRGGNGSANQGISPTDNQATGVTSTRATPPAPPPSRSASSPATSPSS